MRIAERTATRRRERRGLLRVSRAAWRLDQAGRERRWALASAWNGHPELKLLGGMGVAELVDAGVGSGLGAVALPAVAG